MSDKLSRAKEIASSAWSDLSDAVGTQRQIRGLQKQITDRVAERDRVMLEIGRKVYALYGRDKVRNQDILPLCARIDEIGGRIEELNEQVRELAKPQPRGELEPAEVEDETELSPEGDGEEQEEQSEEAEEGADGEPADEDGEEADEEAHVEDTDEPAEDDEK